MTIQHRELRFIDRLKQQADEETLAITQVKPTLKPERESLRQTNACSYWAILAGLILKKPRSKYKNLVFYAQSTVTVISER